MNSLNTVKASLCTLAMLISIGASAAEHVLDQKNKTFVKDGAKVESLTIKAGDSIRFKNEDPFFHNIFSLSDLKTFDLGSFPKGDSKTVTFDKPGKIEVECAIHPEMHLDVTVE